MLLLRVLVGPFFPICFFFFFCSFVCLFQYYSQRSPVEGDLKGRDATAVQLRSLGPEGTFQGEEVLCVWTTAGNNRSVGKGEW